MAPFRKTPIQSIEANPLLGDTADGNAFIAYSVLDAADFDHPGFDHAGKGRKNHQPKAKDDINAKDKVIEAGDNTPGDASAKGNVLANDRDRDGDTLKVSQAGTIEGEFGTLRLSANGKYKYTLDNEDPDTNGLAAGEKAFETFKYTVKDGNGGKDTAVLKIRITGQDDTPPAASVTINAVTADNIVNATEAGADIAVTGTVGGDVGDGDIVTLTINGKAFTGAVAAGAFSIAVPGTDLAADDDATIAASVTTGSGVNSATATDTQAYTVDVTPPALSISVDPLAPDNIVNAAEAGGIVAVTGTVGGDVGDGETVTLTINGKAFTGAVESGAFSIAVPGSDLAADADTTISASVTTTDSAGNSASATGTQTYAVDVTPPDASITLDAVTADNIVNSAEVGGNIVVTGVVANANNGDTVTLTVNGKTFSGDVTSGSFAIAVPGSDLAADGDTTIAASVTTTDGAGNAATATDTQAYSVDTALPAGSILLNAVTADNVVNAAEAAGSAVIAGVVGGDFDSGDVVRLSINGVIYEGAVASGAFSIAVLGSDLTADADQTIAASVSTTDGSGNTVTAEDTHLYAVDTTAPIATVTLDAVTADNIVNATEASGTVAITGTVGGDVRNGDTVIVSVNGKDVTGTVTAGAFSFAVLGSDLAADADKTLAVSVSTSDAAGNGTIAADTQVYTVDTTPPAASILLNAVTADNILNAAEAGGTVTISAVVGADFENGDTVTLSVNGKTLSGVVTDGAVSISVAGSDLAADGDRTIAASISTTDTAGNTVTASDTQAYGVDTTPPAATITLDPIAGDGTVNIAEKDSTAIAITGSVGGDVKDGDSVVLVTNESFFTGTVVAGRFSINLAGSALLVDSDTTLDVTVLTTDAAGNTATADASGTYALDITAPTASIALDPIAGDGIVNIAEKDSGFVAITGTVGGDIRDGDTVNLTVNDTQFAGLVTAGKFSISVDSSSLVLDADTTIVASVSTTDGAGNQGTANATRLYTLDLTPPEASISIDLIAGDDALTDVDVFGVVAVSGIVGPDLADGTIVTIEANDVVYSAEVIQGAFSVAVQGSDIVADKDQNLTASITVTDPAGNSTTASDVRPYSVNFDRDLTTLTPSQGLAVLGSPSFGPVGNSVSSAGDINGDGFGDYIIGSSRLKIEDNFLGGAFVLFGTDQTIGTPDGAGRDVFSLTQITPAVGFSVLGEKVDSYAGFSVSDAGDVNGDGFDDIIIGAPGLDFSENGKAFVVFGTDEGFNNAGAGSSIIVLSKLTTDLGFVMTGATGDNAGFSVSSAGDFNGDGFDDMIVGSIEDGLGTGRAYVVFGSGLGFGTTDVDGRNILDLATLAADKGFVIQGDAIGDYGGKSVSSAGDINGDGLDDLIFGASLGDDNGISSGEAYVIFGSTGRVGTATGGRQVLSMTDLPPDSGFILMGEAGSVTGFSVSSAGDVNGDGFDDMIVGAYGGKKSGAFAGEAYVVFGSDAGFGTVDATGRSVVDLATLAPEKGFVIEGEAAFSYAGFSVSSAGDVNGDGFADMIVGADGGVGHDVRGKAFVVFGTDQGFGLADDTGRNAIKLDTLTAAQGFAILGDSVTVDRTGISVSAAGDVNGDGFDDMIVSALNGNDAGTGAGEAYIVYGGAFGESLTPVTITGDETAGILIGGVRDDVLTGGGADVFRGGNGRDIIGVVGIDFRSIDGGNGYDTLRMDGSGDVFDFTQLSSAAIHSIEAIDMGGGTGNVLNLSALDILDISHDTTDGVTRLTVLGDNSANSVGVSDSGWVFIQVTEIDGDNFNQFGNDHFQLLVDTDLGLDSSLGALLR